VAQGLISESQAFELADALDEAIANHLVEVQIGPDSEPMFASLPGPPGVYRTLAACSRGWNELVLGLLNEDAEEREPLVATRSLIVKLQYLQACLVIIYRELGASWRDIGALLDINHMTVYRRYSRLHERWRIHVHEKGGLWL